MKSYHVTAVDSNGKTIEDIITAENDQELTQIIKSKALFLLEYKEGISTSDSITKLNLKSIVVFCRQLGTMVGAGIPIVQALDMLQSKAVNKKARQIFRNIYEEVQKGNSLSKAMQLQKGAFPELLTNMVMAGELGGTLDKSLGRMSVHYEKDQKLNNKVRSASIYPAILGFVSVAVILMLVTFVLPTITGMFPAENIPWTTAIILGFSNFLTNNYISIIGTILISIVGLRLLLKVRSVKIQFDKLKLLLPVFGPLNQTIYSARCARALASLYASGVQTIEMLETTSRVLNNTYLEDSFTDVITDVSKGEYISKAIAATGSFDPMLSSMIYIGEESGSLGDILNSTADYFDDEADAALQRMIAMFEPIMLIVLGVIIGFIVVSIIQPIFQMYESIGN
jgi:type IV pilus assembly protein PilC